MAIDWDADLLAAVMGVFGEGVAVDRSSWPLYTPQGEAGFHLADAVFDRAYADVTIDGIEDDNTARKPCLGVRMALFALPPRQGDQVYIPSVDTAFVVRDVREDGHGHARLILMAAR